MACWIQKRKERGTRGPDRENRKKLYREHFELSMQTLERVK